MTMFPVMAVFPVHDYSDASVSIDDSVATHAQSACAGEQADLSSESEYNNIIIHIITSSILAI